MGSNAATHLADGFFAPLAKPASLSPSLDRNDTTRPPSWKGEGRRTIASCVHFIFQLSVETLAKLHSNYEITRKMNTPKNKKTGVGAARIRHCQLSIFNCQFVNQNLKVQKWQGFVID
jgi:hypothetical protein